MATDVNLKNFGSGIIENINQLFKGTYKNKPQLKKFLNKSQTQYIHLIKK